MLASPLFRQSKRYAPFLRHVVQKTLDGQEDSLKERTLGVEVFGRAPDYDSNNDPVVRVTAGEVRRRIAQYYHDPAHQNELWIELPTGTYVAQFLPAPAHQQTGAYTAPSAFNVGTEESSCATVAGEGEIAERARRPGKWLLAICIVAAALISVLLVWRLGSFRASVLNRVMAGLVSPNSRTVIAMGEPYLYPREDASRELTAREHLRSVYITISDLQALLRLVRVLDLRHAVYSAQPASATTFADLRQGPAILLGGLDNPWTMRAQRNLRFRLQSDGNGLDWIADARQPGAKTWAVDFNRPYSQVTTDFAIIAYFRDQDTQQPTLIVAGLGENGTKAAGEFITDETQLKNSLGNDLRKTGGGNFEVVLTTEVINGSSGAPRVLAKEIW